MYRWLHLAGGAYITFNQLHHSIRLLEHNIHLSMVMSGEPSKEDLNNCIDPLKDELKQLYSSEYINSHHPISSITSFKGLIMKVYEWRLPQRVHAAMLFDTLNVPASHKLQGAASHSHHKHPCSFCHITLDKINSKEGYDAPSSKTSLHSLHLNLPCPKL